MLRVTAKQIVTCCRSKTLQQFVRNQSVQTNPPKSSSFGKKLVNLTLITGAGATAGVIGYAYKEPKFRQCVEKHAPLTKDLFNLMFGPIE